MFTVKSALLFALFAVSARLVAGDSPPACLLAAVNTEPNPSDLSTVCGSDASKVQSQIQNLCGSNADAGLKAFASVCSAAGKTVVSATASGSASASASSTASVSASGSVTSGPAYPSVTSAPYASGNGTTVFGTTILGSSGFASATSGAGTGSGATGSPIAPSAGSTASGTSSGVSPTFTGAASKSHLSSYAAFIVGAAGAILII